MLKNETTLRLADAIGMSRAHFYRKVRALTHLTPKQYIQNKRFNHAQQLLEKGEMKSVKAVAHAVGRWKVQYFSEQFKLRFGLCAGTSPTLIATATNGGSSPQFYWSKNNAPQGISDFINKTTADGLGANDVTGVYVGNDGGIYAATYGIGGGVSI